VFCFLCVLYDSAPQCVDIPVEVVATDFTIGQLVLQLDQDPLAEHLKKKKRVYSYRSDLKNTRMVWGVYLKPNIADGLG
jgi:hypothetical protein